MPLELLGPPAGFVTVTTAMPNLSAVAALPLSQHGQSSPGQTGADFLTQSPPGNAAVKAGRQYPARSCPAFGLKTLKPSFRADLL